MATNERIINALRESKFRWRTATGVSRDAGLPVREVKVFLDSSDEILKKRTASGRQVYGIRKGKRLKCLVLLPYEPSLSWLRESIFKVLMGQGIDPMSFEDRIQTGALWVDGILESLRACDFLIADVTRRNPNVLFELGIAHGIGKPFVLLVSSESNDDIPSDLLGYQYITYHSLEPRPTMDRLERFVRHLVSRIEKPL